MSGKQCQPWSELCSVALYRNKNVYIILKNDHLWSFFNIIYTFLGSIFEQCYIQNHVIMNCVYKEVVVYIDYSLELPQWGDSNELTQHTISILWLSWYYKRFNVWTLDKLEFVWLLELRFNVNVKNLSWGKSCCTDIWMWQWEPMRFYTAVSF